MKVWLPFVALLTLIGCNNGNSSNTTTTPTTGALITETFTGTVDVGSSDSKPFTLAQAGTLHRTLTQATPPPTIYMGLGVGTPSGSNCALLSGGTTITPAGTTAQLSGTISAGSYCVEVYDVGNQSTQISYTITVAHP